MSMLKKIINKILHKNKEKIAYTEPLNEDGWSKHYNINILNSVINSIETGEVSVWTKELVDIIPENAKVLEIGCGTGISSLWLAKNGRNVTAMDYTEASTQLVTEAARRMKIDNINVVHGDATKDLPFAEKEFDYIFQAGLLEHFPMEEQISLLCNWSKNTKYMISMIPNAASIPYRAGKIILENKGKWDYGLEIPKYTFKEEFIKADIVVEKEYTIGTDWALRFLPKRHYIRKLFSKLEKDGYDLNDFMQGYLLVTVGKCNQGK